MNWIAKRKNVVIIAIVVAAVLTIIAGGFYLFGGHYVGTDEMYDEIQVINQDDRILFSYPMTRGGAISHRSETSKPVLYDYENGVQYKYQYLRITAQRFHLYFNKGTLINNDFILDQTGHEVHTGISKFDPTIDYYENPQLMATRYLRVYYENPDGSLVLVWEHPQAKEIEERIGTPIKEPEEYKLGVSK